MRDNILAMNSSDWDKMSIISGCKDNFYLMRRELELKVNKPLVKGDTW
jgi:hypothetical protein